MPSNNEETDECLLLHALDVLKSFDRVLIKTVESDIVIITITAFRKILSISVVHRVWKRKSTNFILVHEIVLHLRQLTSNELTFFMLSADKTLLRL